MSVLTAILEQCPSFETVAGNTSETISNAICTAEREWDREGPEYSELRASLNPELLRALIKFLHKHKDPTDHIAEANLITPAWFVA